MRGFIEVLVLYFWLLTLALLSAMAFSVDAPNPDYTLWIAGATMVNSLCVTWFIARSKWRDTE